MAVGSKPGFLREILLPEYQVVMRDLSVSGVLLLFLIFPAV